jgi:uncharacterized integral membrane protein (TIGR00697 family)
MNASPRFVVIAAVFVTCLITANVIAVKVVSLGPLIVPAAIFVFPLSYIFGDVLTEVYGYHQARKVIWLGFICNLVFVFFAWVGELLPPLPEWPHQAAYERILGPAPWILVASFLGYLAGEFTNSFVLAKMKVITRGRWLWTRTVGSTVIGQGLDTAIFILILTLVDTPGFTAMMILHHWPAKIVIEALATPATYAAVGYLKKREGTDTYDYGTNFNPFLIRDRQRKAIGQ